MAARCDTIHGKALLLLAGLACAPPAPLRYEDELERSAPPARHAVRSEQLAAVMRDLRALAYTRLDQSLDPGMERERRVAQVVAAARAVARSAELIPAAAAQSGLAGEEAARFQEQAALLANRARHLADEAPRLDDDQLRSALEDIDETCSGCHSRFREGAPE